MPKLRDEPTVVVVGSTMVDMIVYLDEAPRAGETVVGQSFSLGFGGKGANQAVMCALLGATVRFVGSVGSDVYGDSSLGNLASFGIDTAATTRAESASTGVAPIWVDSSGENRIVVVPGANELLDPAAADRAIREHPPDVVLCQLELPEECVRKALLAAREVNALPVLNPAPMTNVALEVLGLCAWLIPNESELESIAIRLDMDPERSAEELAVLVTSELGVDLVVTVGAKGAILCRRADGHAVAIPAPSVAQVDATGAGDAFVGAFAYAIALGAHPRDAVAFGCGCASASVEERGTQSPFPRAERLAELKEPLTYLVGQR